MEFLKNIGQPLNRDIAYDARLLTKEDAIKLLSKNTKNRKVSKKKTKDYRLAMSEGKWQLNGLPILFSSEGVLIDGQHRLIALSEQEDDIQIPFIIGYGLESNSFDTIDIGKKRSPADLFSIYGVSDKEAGPLSAAGKLLHTYILNHDTKNKIDLQNKDIYDFVCLPEYKNLFEEGVQKVFESDNLTFTKSESIFLYVLLVGLNREKGEIFCNQIYTGTNIQEKSPVQVLQSRIKKPHKDKDRMFYAITAWNFFVKDIPMEPSAYASGKVKKLGEIKALAPMEPLL